MHEKRKVYLLVNNHFDLTWRRKFHGKIEHEGKRIASYSELQQWYIDDNLELIERHPDYKFEVESVAVLKEYLSTHPEKREVLKKLFAEGRFYVTGCGICIIDSNMVEGESIIRNFLMGQLWMRGEYGSISRDCNCTDRFGNSAQIPQIASQCGMRFMTGIGYSTCDERYWRGLDGTVICVDPVPKLGRIGHWWKYAPCEQCDGDGTLNGETCGACNGRGIGGMIKRPYPTDQSVMEADDRGTNMGFVSVGGEEMLPGADTYEWAHAEHPFDAEFAITPDLYPAIQKILDRDEAIDEAEIHFSAEMNPNNTGCYVTRIYLKQGIRRIEARLRALEELFSLSEEGNDYPKVEMDWAWERLSHLAFHDCVTGEHAGPSDREILEWQDELEERLNLLENKLVKKQFRQEGGLFSVFNPSGRVQDLVFTRKTKHPASFTQANGDILKPLMTERTGDGRYEYLLKIDNVPAFTLMPVLEKAADAKPSGGQRRVVDNSVREMKAQGVLQSDPDDGVEETDVSDDVYSIENEYYVVRADANGIFEIQDKANGKILAKAGKYRIGEWIVKHDEGSPWANFTPGDEDDIPLAGRTQIKSIEVHEGCQIMNFNIHSDVHLTYSTDAFEINWSVILKRGVRHIDFEARVWWDEYNRRISIVFPAMEAGRHIYDIPYGMIERKPYAPWVAWAGTDGSWPAVHWAGVEGKEMSVAVFNHGTPSYRIDEDGLIWLSVLRSPTLPTYLHEPRSYTMDDYDRMRDEGDHDFRYALAFYGGTFADSTVSTDAAFWNDGPMVLNGKAALKNVPVQSENAVVSSIKQSEDGKATVFRVVEYRGKKGVVYFDGEAEVCDVLECPVKKVCSSVEIAPFQILTLKFEKATD